MSRKVGVPGVGVVRVPSVSTAIQDTLEFERLDEDEIRMVKAKGERLVRACERRLAVLVAERLRDEARRRQEVTERLFNKR